MIGNLLIPQLIYCDENETMYTHGDNCIYTDWRLANLSNSSEDWCSGRWDLGIARAAALV